MKIDRTSIKQTFHGSWSVRVYYEDRSFKNSFFATLEEMIDYLETLYDVD